MCAAFYGMASHAKPHKHAAIQIVCASGEDIAVSDSSGTVFTNELILIRPLVAHCMVGGGNARIIYVEPQSQLAQTLIREAGSNDVEPLEGFLELFTDENSPKEWLNAVEGYTRTPASDLDPRLVLAMDRLSMLPGECRIQDAADAVDLSDSRLRALARIQLGVPLSTWLIWRKLELAGQALVTGSTLSTAALSGGFADQAHFSRVMRQMFGVTATSAASILRATV